MDFLSFMGSGASPLRHRPAKKAKNSLEKINQKKGKEFHNFIKSSVKKSGANVIHLLKNINI